MTLWTLGKLIKSSGKLVFNGNIRSMSSSLGVPLSDIIKKLEAFAPLNLSEKWDNTGILVQPSTPRLITKILLTNDLTEDVMEEAADLQTELIISYHPPIFSGLKRITQSNWKERIVSKCLELRIAVYSPHTSWDSVDGGVNDWLAECLPPHDRKFIAEGAVPGSGQGRLCLLNETISLGDLVNSVKSHTRNDKVMLALARNSSPSARIESVALCAGSGVSVLRGTKANVFLTGEMSHHDVLDAVHCGTSVILTNHSNSERGFLSAFSKRLENMMEEKVKTVISQKDHDPLKFV